MKFENHLIEKFFGRSAPRGFTCPRRSDIAIGLMGLAGQRPDPGEYADYCENALGNPGPDGWVSRDGELHCNYCGSLHPDRFMEMVKNGAEIGPTDKNYKVYLDSARTKFYTVHLSREQAQELKELLTVRPVDNSDKYMTKARVGHPGYFYNGLYLHPAKGEGDEN